MGTGTELEYCTRCGTSGPPIYFKERNGLDLCPQCFNEEDLFYSDEFDLFEDWADNFKPDQDG